MQIESQKPKNFLDKILTTSNKITINTPLFRKTCRFTSKTSNKTNKNSIYYKNNGLTIGYEGKQTLGLDISRYQTNLSLDLIPNKIFYFETKINNIENDGIISIGLTKKNFPFKKFPGSCRKSGDNFGYCSNGEIKNNKNKSFHYKLFEKNDIIGFGYNFIEKIIFLTFNKQLLEFKFCDVPMNYYFPTLGMSSDSFEVTFNFGNTPFDFDIANYVINLESRIYKSIFFRKNFEEINNNILNYFLVNGYEKCFLAFWKDLVVKKNLKFVMNEKDKIKNLDMFYPKKKIVKKRTKSFRRDSERFSSRRSSVKKLENIIDSDNKEVQKLLKIRNGKIKRIT